MLGAPGPQHGAEAHGLVEDLGHGWRLGVSRPLFLGLAVEEVLLELFELPLEQQELVILALLALDRLVDEVEQRQHRCHHDEQQRPRIAVEREQRRSHEDRGDEDGPGEDLADLLGGQPRRLEFGAGVAHLHAGAAVEQQSAAALDDRVLLARPVPCPGQVEGECGSADHERRAVLDAHALHLHAVHEHAVGGVEVDDLDVRADLEPGVALGDHRVGQHDVVALVAPERDVARRQRELLPGERPRRRAQHADDLASVGGDVRGADLDDGCREARADGRLADRDVGVQRHHARIGRRRDRERQRGAIREGEGARRVGFGDVARHIAGRRGGVGRDDDVDRIALTAMQGQL